MPKTKYVVGFLFSEDRGSVALIKKNRPAWQKGRLNGIGGHVETSDASNAAAISREFLEETGVAIPASKWKQFSAISSPDAEVTFFKCFSQAIEDVASETDEPVAIYEVSELLQGNYYARAIPNLAWLIPMALEVGILNQDPEYVIEEKAA